MTEGIVSESDRKAAHKKNVAAMPPAARQAHTHCTRNWMEINSSDLAGCFYCLSIFTPSKIVEWHNEETFETGSDGSPDCTAFCPDCHVDSVIGSKSGFPIERDFLAFMHSYWFR